MLLTPTYLPQNEEEGCLALLIITLTGSYYYTIPLLDLVLFIIS